MAISGKIKIKGGQKLARYLLKAKRNNEKLRETKAEIGFLEPRISTLAALHELGQRGRDGVVPARPAFGDSVAEVRAAVKRALRAEAKGAPGLIDPAAMAAAAAAGLREVVKSYQSAPGPELSERQEARKRGTPGEGRKLVGSRGERLIGHLQARVSGQKVGE